MEGRPANHVSCDPWKKETEQINEQTLIFLVQVRVLHCFLKVFLKKFKFYFILN